MSVSTLAIVMSPLVKQGENQFPDRTEGSLLVSLQIGDISYVEGTILGAKASPNLHLPNLGSPQCTTLSDAGQHYTRMRCYFHYQHNCFRDYFDDPVPDCTVIYTVDILFKYTEQEGMYRGLW